jgi:hypothetical protein
MMMRRRKRMIIMLTMTTTVRFTNIFCEEKEQLRLRDS